MRTLRNSLLAIVTLSFISVASFFPAVYATAYSGTATKCTSLAICAYSLTGGSASVAGGISGYIGQNFTFYSGSVSFKLPGETLLSNDGGVYSGQAINTKVFTTAAGLIYKITGTFAAPDVNTKKIINGVTHGFVGIKGHSGRGGGIYYVLVNGTITLNPTKIDTTSMRVSCNPSSYFFSLDNPNPTTCTAKVTDLAQSSSIPTGQVIFSNYGYSYTGTFNPVSCKLSSGSCSVQFTPSIADSGSYSFTIVAAYGGDTTHYKSSNSTVVSVTAN
jgi:hypothetical protein